MKFHTANSVHPAHIDTERPLVLLQADDGRPKLNLFATTGHVDFLGPERGDRRFWPVDLGATFAERRARCMAPCTQVHGCACIRFPLTERELAGEPLSDDDRAQLECMFGPPLQPLAAEASSELLEDADDGRPVSLWRVLRANLADIGWLLATLAAIALTLAWLVDRMNAARPLLGT